MRINKEWRKEIEWTCKMHRCSRFVDKVIQQLERDPYIEYHTLPVKTRHILNVLLRQEYFENNPQVKDIKPGMDFNKPSASATKVAAGSIQIKSVVSTPQTPPVINVQGDVITANQPNKTFTILQKTPKTTVSEVAEPQETTKPIKYKGWPKGKKRGTRKKPAPKPISAETLVETDTTGTTDTKPVTQTIQPITYPEPSAFNNGYQTKPDTPTYSPYTPKI